MQSRIQDQNQVYLHSQNLNVELVGSFFSTWQNFQFLIFSNLIYVAPQQSWSGVLEFPDTSDEHPAPPVKNALSKEKLA